MNDLQRGIYQPLADKVPIYDLADEDPEEERSRAPLLVVIALVVLAGFAGVVWLAYNQGVERGRQGASLVIEAPEGPVRVAPPESEPSTPGLSVYQPPVSPEKEAQTSKLAPQAPPPPPQAAAAQAAPAIRVAPPAPAPAPAPQRPAAAPAPAQTAQAARPPQPATPPAPAQTAKAAPPAVPAPASAQTAQAAPAASPPAATSRALSGAAVLQIGAFESMELANGAWAAFRSKYDGAGQLAPDIQRADLGTKGVFYRLRVGPFADREAAADACIRLRAEGATCFVSPP